MKIRQLSSSAVLRGPFSKTMGFPSPADMEQVTDRLSVLAVGRQLMISFWCSARGALVIIAWSWTQAINNNSSQQSVRSSTILFRRQRKQGWVV